MKRQQDQARGRVSRQMRRAARRGGYTVTFAGVCGGCGRYRWLAVTGPDYPRARAGSLCRRCAPAVPA